MSNKNFLIKNGLSIGADNEVISSARAASFESASITGDLTVDSTTLKVDSSNNRVGIGTSSPAETLEVSGDIKATKIGMGISPIVPCEVLSTGATSTALRVLKSGSDDSTQNNLFSVTEISGHGRLSIHDSSQNEDIRFDSNGNSYFNGGNVGIGTTSPSGNLHVASTGDGLVLSRSGYDTYSLQHSAGGGMAIYNVTDSKSAMYFDGSSRVLINRTSSASTNGRLDVFRDSGEHCINCEVAGTSNSTLVGFFNANGFVGGINTSGSSTSFNTSSDYRLKENVNYEFDALSRVKQLKPARFNFIADADTTVDGFIAHEVSDIVPEAITGEKDGEQMQGIDQSKLVPLLTKAIQELEARVKELEG